MSMNSCDFVKYNVAVGVRDCIAFPICAAVDNLIKITAAENSCRYSHALAAYNNVTGNSGHLLRECPFLV